LNSLDLSDRQNPLGEIRELLKRVDKLKEGHASERLSTIGAILEESANVEQRRLVRAREGAPQHNLFRLLGIERSEVGLHSRLLADLLDPYGSHGQGALFLQRFFQMLGRHDREIGDLAGAIPDTPPRWEWAIGRERERIDISIRNRRLGILIFIENKIDAGEREKQLEDYRKLLEGHTSYRCHRLIYLSPKSKGPPMTGSPHLHLTYEDDIRAWLLSCLSEVRASRIRETLAQYLDIISDLSR